LIRTAVLTISSTRVPDNDSSGIKVKELCGVRGLDVVFHEIVSDKKKEIKDRLLHCIRSVGADVIFTIGGTGLGPDDVTPDATRDVIEREIPGIPEHIRRYGSKKTDRAILSRGTAGICEGRLIINLPGSPRGASESFEAVSDVIEHALQMAAGGGH
jgi:molybdenum cofactor synthesis domain-containing protein